jgi:hypothetical protein
MEAEEDQPQVMAGVDASTLRFSSNGDGMTLRERWWGAMVFPKGDFIPNFEFGFWDSTCRDGTRKGCLRKSTTNSEPANILESKTGTRHGSASWDCRHPLNTKCVGCRRADRVRRRPTGTAAAVIEPWLDDPFRGCPPQPPATANPRPRTGVRAQLRTPAAPRCAPEARLLSHSHPHRLAMPCFPGWGVRPAPRKAGCLTPIVQCGTIRAWASPLPASNFGPTPRRAGRRFPINWVCVGRHGLNRTATVKIEAQATGLGATRVGRIPYDPAITAAQRQGGPVIEWDPGRSATAAILRLWKRIGPEILSDSEHRPVLPPAPPL